MTRNTIRQLALLLLLSATLPALAFDSALDLKPVFEATVARRLTLPEAEQHYYAELVRYQLQQAGLANLPSQYLLLIDRSSKVQAALLLWLGDKDQVELIGAAPVSTGKNNGFEYFETPLGLFEHSRHHLDFRAEGTKNQLGLMGYGVKGMRVYDFGWVNARKTWVEEVGQMRLQLHSTDPKYLERKLGTRQSKGCVRIAADLNTLLDHYGILDADYESAQTEPHIAALLDPSRVVTPWAGRYMLIVDSRRVTRPTWAALPK